MFDLSDSKRTPGRIWPWVMHYFFAVVVPLLLLELFNGLIGFNYSNRSAGQAILEYVLIGGIGFLVGIVACFSLPLMASVARKSWIIPLAWLVFGVCWDLHSSPDWRAIISKYIIFLPDGRDNAEPWVSYWVFSFPCFASISYAVGNTFCGIFLLKALL